MPTLAETQVDLDFNVENPDWVALKIVLSEIDQELRDRRRHLLMKVAHWFLAIKLFRKFEDLRLFVGEPTDRDKEYHRYFLTQLMAGGELLLIDLRRQADVDPGSIGIQLADVEANLCYLRDCHAQWYTDLSPTQKADILKECFGEG